MLEIIERWEGTKMPQGIQENLVADMAYLLENQFLFNKKYG